MNFFLQSNELWVDAWWLMGIAILSGVFFFTLRYLNHKQERRRAESHDPKAAILNETNYNISRSGIEEHRTAINSESEAKRALEAFKESGELPTNEEFAALRRQLKKS